MSKVVLISPPYVDLYGKLNLAAGRYFPLGLGYIASYLRRYGDHEIQIYEPEAQGLTYTDLAKVIHVEKPDVIGLTCSTPPSTILAFELSFPIFAILSALKKFGVEQVKPITSGFSS